MNVLAGDIGGTNCRLIIAEITASNYSIKAEVTYASHNYNQFYDVLLEFIKQYSVTLPVDAVCLAVAGPVFGQKVKLTNLPWCIEYKTLMDILHTENIRIINDFTAVAFGLPLLGKMDQVNIQASDSKQSSSDAVIVGAGTGLGAIHLLRRDDLYLPLPSEAGHAGFAPANSMQTQLLGWLQDKQGYVCLEHLLSGTGIYTIYDFLKSTGDFRENLSVTHKLSTTDPAAVITQYALDNSDELCVQTLELFVDIYASAAADIALHYFPIGEVYIAGGIAPRIRSLIESPRFIQAFNRKGLMSSNLRSLDVKLILQEKIGLYGAMSYAASMHL